MPRNMHTTPPTVPLYPREGEKESEWSDQLISLMTSITDRPGAYCKATASCDPVAKNHKLSIQINSVVSGPEQRANTYNLHSRL